MSNIRFLKRSEIDLQAWNHAIANSLNTLPYAFTWYLDAVAEHWDALILDDYKAIMPLVWLRKFGVKCLYQPYYCQQLGVFSATDLSPSLLRSFITAAREKFLYIHINLNPSVAGLEKELHLKRKKNLLLDLSPQYQQLKKKYAENHRRNISKAEKSDTLFSENTSLKDFQKFYLANVDRKKENFKKKHEVIFRSLTNALIDQGKGKIFTGIDIQGEIKAAVMMITYEARIVNIINCSSDSGKKAGASHFLFDNIIRKYAATSQMLDFEGSSIPGVARFYEGFGAKEEVFYNLQKIPFKLGQ